MNDSPTATNRSTRVRGNENDSPSARTRISDPGEWLLWCQENKVLKQNVDLVHYEFEACRRHFNTLKFNPNDGGVHLKTLANSFYQSELFPSYQEAYFYCQKLSDDPAELITYSDLLDATQAKNSYQRNKARLYVKFVASSEMFQNAVHAHEAHSSPSSSSSSSLNPKTLHFSSTADILSSSTELSMKTDGKVMGRLDSVSENPSPPPSHRQAPHSNDSQPGGDSHTKPSNVFSGTIATGRKVLVRLYSNATDMLTGIFDHKGGPAPSSSSTTTVTAPATVTVNSGSDHQPSRVTHRQESRGFMKLFSRSYSRAPSFCDQPDPLAATATTATPSSHRAVGREGDSRHHPHKTSIESELWTEEKNSAQDRSHSITTSASAVLQKLESNEDVGNFPQVKSKRAALKIYTHGQFIHSFPARNGRVAVEGGDGT
jgi:hypothetical protein